MARQGLSDSERSVIEDVFPKPKATERPPIEAHRVMEGAVRSTVEFYCPLKERPLEGWTES
jgi:hypothetical protein